MVKPFNCLTVHQRTVKIGAGVRKNKDGSEIKLTLQKNVYCAFHNGTTVAMVLAESEAGALHVLTATGASADTLANYGSIGEAIEVEATRPLRTWLHYGTAA